MENKICPKCNTENPLAANFCRKCRYEFPEETKKGTSLKPRIKTFSVIEDEYVVGSSIHIAWEVENFTSLSLNGEDASSYTDAEYFVEKPSTIKLIALNDYDQTEAILQIKPKTCPRITKFSSNFQRVRPNQKFKLSWSLEKQTKVYLNDGTSDIDVSGRFSFETKADEDTTYTLRCATADPEVFIEKQLTVKVVAETVITKFLISSNFIIESECVELTWDVKNADQIILYPNGTDVTGKTSIQLFPSRTTEYRLICRNSISECQESVSVCVKPLPRIDLKMDDIMGSINIPTCSVQMDNILPDISETKIEGFLSGQFTDSIEKRLSRNSIFKKAQSLLNKHLKI